MAEHLITAYIPLQGTSSQSGLAACNHDPRVFSPGCMMIYVFSFQLEQHELEFVLLKGHPTCITQEYHMCT